jgi:hypothetical protein
LSYFIIFLGIIEWQCWPNDGHTHSNPCSTTLYVCVLSHGQVTWNGCLGVDTRIPLAQIVNRAHIHWTNLVRVCEISWSNLSMTLVEMPSEWMWSRGTAQVCLGNTN